MLHYFLGDRLVRELTLASRAFVENPPGGFADAPLGHPMPVLIHGRDDEREALDSLAAEISQFAQLHRLDAKGVHDLCPLLKNDARHGLVDRNAIRLDPHALLQGNLRQLRRSGGTLASDARVVSIRHSNGSWQATSATGESFAAPILINAAGSWADAVATLAGVPPLGFQPLRR